MRTETLNVTGMESEAAMPAVIRALSSVGGVQTIKVSYANENAIVEYDEHRTATQELLSALARAGFSRDMRQEKKAGQGSCCGGCCG